jgi:hypothetical protein
VVLKLEASKEECCALDFIGDRGVARGVPGVRHVETGGVLNGHFWIVDPDRFVFVVRCVHRWFGADVKAGINGALERY